ncbi:hypothetical protein MATL_G00068490 [Megalops atlanticus]|uniref:Neural cell adhesion molecule L1 n=1 Tax=Megalops atlanticus TaxID=7932 RepID=A0A9D3Q3X0_MEGAT|nr:hypothetical protein MATL_G00068490 [Megalops atlanticus]
MPSVHRWQLQSRGQCASLPLLLLLLVIMVPGPALAAIHIPSLYQINDLKGPPVITTQPQSGTAFSVDDIILTCEASGNPPPTFRWVKDGKQFDPTSYPRVSTSKSSGTFFVASNGPISQYQGKYRCYASNELGTAVSNEVQIITENTPTLPKEKKVMKKVGEGESVVLVCDPPFSTIPPHIHWMDKKLRHIDQSERVTTGLDGSLYFAHVIPSDSRDDYTCNAQYIAARTILPKEPISLSVMPSNSVVQHRRPQLLRPSGTHSHHLALMGKELVLECLPEGLPTPRVQWLRKDRALSESDTTKMNFDRWLLFNNISQDDDGEYQCTATNKEGEATHTYTITVEAAPYWTKLPKSQLYAPGETVRLDCHAEGIPTPNVTWSINGNPISGIDPDPRLRVHVGTLILKDVKSSDTAVYQCEASNKHGNIMINTYINVIELPPQILTEDGEKYRVTEGQTALLKCDTFGSPLPKVTWEGGSSDLVLSNPRVSQLTSGVLQITNSSQEDSGLYTCSVLNSNLSIMAQLEVLNRTIIVLPPQPLRVRRGDSANLTCHALVDPRMNHVQMQWRKGRQKLFPSSSDDKYTFDDNSLKIVDVQPEDEAEYTCEFITNLDLASASASIIVVDRPDPPLHLKLSDLQDRSITLSWTPGDEHNSPIQEFVVESEELSLGEDRWREEMRVEGDIRQVEIQLQPFCTYRFRVTAVSELGSSDSSTPSEAYSTPPAAPDNNPTHVRSESIDPDSLVITWKEMDQQSFNGPGFQYRVLWRQAEGKGPNWQSNFTRAPPFIVHNTGTFTPFEIKVQAVNQKGEGPPPNPVIGYSGEDLPLAAPTDVRVEQVDSSTVLVRWEAVKRETVRGHLLGYKIHLRRLGSLDGRGHLRHRGRERRERGPEGDLDSRVVEVLGASRMEQEVGGLQLYSHYTLTVSAFNSKGEGPHSQPHTFHTPEGAPSPPASLEFDSPSETELVLHWKPPTQLNGVLIGYVLQYQEIVDSNDSPLRVQKIDDPMVSHFRLGSLDPHSRYRFYLLGRTAAGLGKALVKEAATLLDGGPPSNISLSLGETFVNLSWVPKERYRNIGFYIYYQRNSAGAPVEVSDEVNSTQSFYQLQGLQPGTHYLLNFIFSNNTFWKTDIRTEGPGLSEVQGGFATQGWFIGLISAIVLLLLVLLILCFIKRSKGGKYSVKDKEEGQVDSEARPMKDETFGEYSDNEEKRSASQPSLCVESKLGSEDSLAEYGDSVDIQFNEDGSFIGQYSGHRDGPGPGGPDSSGATSPINPTLMPPANLGIPNSVTGVLERGH